MANQVTHSKAVNGKRTKDMKQGDIAVIIESMFPSYVGSTIMKIYGNHRFVNLSDGVTWSDIDPNFGVDILKPGESVTLTAK